MKEEKGKIILIYVLMALVIVLIIALTFVVLGSIPKKEKNLPSTSNNLQVVDVNPYPNVNQQCTFNVSIEQYNALTMAGCKGGYTRYNIESDVNGKKLLATIIYSDKNGNKTGVFVNDKKVINKVLNVTNFKLGLIDNKLFIANNSAEPNVLAYDETGVKVYDLRAQINKEKIKDPAFKSGKTLTASNIKQNSFSFTSDRFTFQTQDTGAGQFGSNYQVLFNGQTFSKITFISIIG